MWITCTYLLFWFASLLSNMLDKSVIAWYFTLILSSSTFFCFFLNHRAQVIIYILSKVFHKFIAETNVKLKCNITLSLPSNIFNVALILATSFRDFKVRVYDFQRNKLQLWKHTIKFDFLQYSPSQHILGRNNIK